MLATLLRRLLRRSSICAACLSLEIETMQKETIHPHKSYMMNSSYALPTPSRPLHPHLFPSHLPLNRAPRPAPSKGVLLATEGAEARPRPVVFPLDDLRRLPKVSSFLSRTAAGRAASERIARARHAGAEVSFVIETVLRKASMPCAPVVMTAS